MAIRLIVDTPDAGSISGSDATYTGNDGQVYACKLMPDGEWWTVENLVETKFRDGTDIPIVPAISTSTWENTLTPAMTYYFNEQENAITITVVNQLVITVPGEVINGRFIEYYSVNTSHNIDWLYYVPETEAEDVQANLHHALSWGAAGMILQIIERVDLAKVAFEQEQACYKNLYNK